MKNRSTAKSPANIAFIKFWGKKDPDINIPFNNSISMNLSACFTLTTVEFSKDFKKDIVLINKEKVEGSKGERVIRILDIVRKKAKIKSFAKVVSKNNFPSDAGIASSASGFSALALAASKAAGINLNQKELSILARLGSGSASRSITDGFSEWKAGKGSNSSYAISIAKPGFWDLRDLVVVVSSGAKKSSSTEGHSVAQTSPYFKTRQMKLKKRTKDIRKALLKKDFSLFGKLLEEEAIDLHVMAMTSNPPVYYWNGGTVEVMTSVREMREEGLECYFTMDAGPNVHVICLGKDEKKIKLRLKKIKGVKSVISNKASEGARIIHE